MDPANYSEHSLPKIKYEHLARMNTYDLDDPESYDELKNDFISYAPNCCAITYDDEIIYNVYKKLTIREHVLEDMIRDTICDEPEYIFLRLFKKNESCRIILYMFGDNPWFMAYYYDPELNIIRQERYAKYGIRTQSNETLEPRDSS